jgi:hypothetical protein
VRAGRHAARRLQKVPAEFHAELLALNRLGDRALLDIADGGGPRNRAGRGQLYDAANFQSAAPHLRALPAAVARASGRSVRGLLDCATLIAEFLIDAAVLLQD